MPYFRKFSVVCEQLKNLYIFLNAKVKYIVTSL